MQKVVLITDKNREEAVQLLNSYLEDGWAVIHNASFGGSMAGTRDNFKSLVMGTIVIEK